MTKAEKEAAKAAKLAEKEAETEIESSDDIIVGDPQILRPVELPLVVKLPNGKEWDNEAQAEYVKYLNAYAYKNPKKWAKKKDALIARLKSLATEPELLNVFKGESGQIEGQLEFKNKLIQK